MKIGFIHGRFQILHNDHMKYLLAGKKHCDHLVVGITNPDPTLTKDDATDSHRSSQGANPLTYYERYVMVRAALLEAGLSFDQFAVVPFPVNSPELYQYYIPGNAVFFLTGLTSSEIRSKVAHGEKFGDLVPPSVSRLIKELGLAERLQNLLL